MGRLGRVRIERDLGWPKQRDAYIRVYDNLLGRTRPTADRTQHQVQV
jgi:hypothetical protein